MADLTSVLKNHKKVGRDNLIPLLQDVQEVEGYLSRDAIYKIAEHLELPASKVYGVATFYNQFRFHPPGKHHIQVCRGTACHVKGSQSVLEELKNQLSIEPGETTRDGVFSLEVVACVGACGLAPVVSVNGDFYSRVTPQDVEDILTERRNQTEGQNQ